MTYQLTVEELVKSLWRLAVDNAFRYYEVCYVETKSGDGRQKVNSDALPVSLTS